MAIKTQTELVTQSDNTFLDNTTGQIIPTNHRLWNEDVLETMFEGIAGRTVTKSEFDTLVANSELVEGCVYKITNYPLAIGNNEIYVTANSSNTIYGQAYCYVLDSRHFLFIEPNGNDAKVFTTLGRGASGFTLGELFEYINNLIGIGFYEVGADCKFFTNAGSNNAWLFEGRIATQADTILNHNILSSYEITGLYNLHKGFLSERPINQRKFFYPDHGTQDRWGDYGIINAGDFGVLEFRATVLVSNFGDIKGNFQKVNNMVMGQVSCSCTLTDGSVNTNIDFGLPISGAINDTFIAHGVARAINDTHQFTLMDITAFDSGDDSIGRSVIAIIGNHNGNISIKMSISFSYLLEY